MHIVAEVPGQEEQEVPKKRRKPRDEEADALPTDQATAALGAKKRRKAVVEAGAETELEHHSPKKRKKPQGDAAEVEAAPGAPDDDSQARPPKAAADPDGAPASGLTVFVGGLPWACGEDVLRTDFSECGEVTKVNLLTNTETGQSKGIAFIAFKDRAGVTAALAYDGKEYGGRTLRVSEAEDRDGKGSGKGRSSDLEVFIKGMDRGTTEKRVRKYFKRCGEIEKVSMPLNPEGHCKGFAWITFTTSEAANAAVELNGSEFNGKDIEVEKSGLHLTKGAKGKGKASGKGDAGLEVFVKNFPFNVDEDALRSHFRDCGEIEKLRMPMRNGKECMGFAWITFKSKDAVEKAVELHGTEYAGRNLVVEKSGQHRSKGKGKGTR